MTGQGLDSQPEVPEGDVIFVGETGDGLIDQVVAFEVIGFGRQIGTAPDSITVSMMMRMYFS